MPFGFENQQQFNELNGRLKTGKPPGSSEQRQPNAQRKPDNLYDGILDWLQETPLHYVAQLDRYVVKDANNNWAFLKPAALPRTYPILADKKALEALSMAMDEMGRSYLYVTYSFHDHPQTLNLLDTSDWLKPMVGQHHWLFDVLIRSLGCDKPENMGHLKHVITYKYQHPDCWLLPCIVIYGAGRVGKNVLVDSVLHTIWCGRTVSATADFLLSDFNSLLKGMVAVCINETVVGKHDRSKLYNTLAKARIEINEKGVPQYEVDNTPLYFIGSNDWNGATMLD
jgi:hypothetical protein